MKRIIEETLESGEKQYRVESNRVLGFIPWWWHTCTYTDDAFGTLIITKKAIFHTYKEAREYIGIPDAKVKDRKVVWES